jgi:hypothetical protein
MKVQITSLIKPELPDLTGHVSEVAQKGRFSVELPFTAVEGNAALGLVLGETLRGLYCFIFLLDAVAAFKPVPHRLQVDLREVVLRHAAAHAYLLLSEQVGAWQLYRHLP